MPDNAISAEQTAAITAFVDIHAPPPNDLPTAHFVFGTNQLAPVTALITERYKRNLAPLIIVTRRQSPSPEIEAGVRSVRQTLPRITDVRLPHVGSNGRSPPVGNRHQMAP